MTTSGRAFGSSACLRRRWKYCAEVVALTIGCSPVRPAGGTARGVRSNAPSVPLVAGGRSVRRDVWRHWRPGNEELVDDDLRAVDEVAELGFPEDERLRGGHGDLYSKPSVAYSESGEL